MSPDALVALLMILLYMLLMASLHCSLRLASRKMESAWKKIERSPVRWDEGEKSSEAGRCR